MTTLDVPVRPENADLRPRTATPYRTCALIGLGGLGYLIVTIGTNRGSFGLTATLVGIVLAVGLAVLADVALHALQRVLTPWSRRRTAPD